MQRFVKILCVTFCLLTFPIASHAACSILVDGEPLVAKDADGNIIEPFIENGSTYIPVRAVASAFNTNISWDQSTLTVYIGTNGGSPSLNEYINIYYNGEEFTAKDANGDIVRPILRDGATYLPVRAIGELFGKNVSWDNISQTVSLASPCSSSALSYFKSALLNTEIANLTADVSFKGNLSYNGALISEETGQATEDYKSSAFSLSSFLPADYDSYLSYLGQGKYFLNVPSANLSSSVMAVLAKRGVNMEFSNLYINVETHGGYITSINISAFGNAAYSYAVFNSEFTISASVNYPDSFQFLLVPFPSGGTESEKAADASSEQTTSVSEDIPVDSDITDISALAASYIERVLASDAEGVSALLSRSDYVALFSARSDSQIRLDFTTASRNLASKYSNADGSYTVDSLDYISDTSPYGDSCEKAVNITAGVLIHDGDNTRADELTFTLIKTDGAWYIDKESMQKLL